MTYDRDLRRLRWGIAALFLLNLAALVVLVHQHLWIQAAAAGVWTTTCAGWLLTIRCQQLSRDWARIYEAGLRDLKRQIERGYLDE
jgi:hypothetical protein